MFKRTEIENINIPDNWGMLTGRGNRALHGRARTFLMHLKPDPDEIPLDEKIRAAMRFLRSYRRMWSREGLEESADTDVEDRVWGFFSLVCKAADMETFAEKLWTDKKGFPK